VTQAADVVAFAPVFLVSLAVSNFWRKIVTYTLNGMLNRLLRVGSSTSLDLLLLCFGALLVAPASAQTTLNMSDDLVRLGIAPTNMVPNQPSLDSRPLFEQGVAFAIKNGFNKVIADPGSYYFQSLWVLYNREFLRCKMDFFWHGQVRRE
jgi:hypothetical protein